MKKIAVFLAILATFCLAEEEKGMWQKFVDFFSPSSSVTGDSELEQNIQKLDKKIQSTKSDYNREHRPQRKSMLKRELEDLTFERDSLITVLEKQKNAPAVSSSSTPSSSSVTSSSSELVKQPVEHCDTVWVIEKRVVHDTILVRDTILVHDTIYLPEQARQGSEVKN